MKDPVAMTYAQPLWESLPLSKVINLVFTGCFWVVCASVTTAFASAIFNTLRPTPNEQHFADDIFKRISFNENVWISIKISVRFVSKGAINNIPALVQIMAWRRSGDKPLSEPTMVSLPTHTYVTRPRWVNIAFCRMTSSHDKFHLADHAEQSINLP